MCDVSLLAGIYEEIWSLVQVSISFTFVRPNFTSMRLEQQPFLKLDVTKEERLVLKSDALQISTLAPVLVNLQ